MKLSFAALVITCTLLGGGETFVHGKEGGKGSVSSSSIFKHSELNITSADNNGRDISTNDLYDLKNYERQSAAWDFVKSLATGKTSDLYESVDEVATFTRMKYVVVPIWWNNFDTEDPTYAMDLNIVRERLNLVEQYYKDMSWNKMDLTFVLHSEQVVLPLPSNNPSQPEFKLAGRKLVADLGYVKGVDYDGIVMSTFRGSSVSYNWAEVNGDFIAIVYMVEYYIGWQALRHEVGHNIGHPHHMSDSYNYRETRPKLTDSPFDGWDMMSGGNAYEVSDLAAASKWFFNWIPDSSIVHMQPEGPTYECPNCLSAGTFTLSAFDERQVPLTEDVKMGIHIPIASVDDKLYSYWLSYRGAGNLGFAAKGLSVHLGYFSGLSEPLGATYDSQNYDAYGDTNDVDGTRDSFVEVGTCYHIFPSAYMKDIDIVSVTEVQPIVCVDSIDVGTSITVSVSFLDPINPPSPSISTIETTINCTTSGFSTFIEVSNNDYNLIRVNLGGDGKIELNMNRIGYFWGTYATKAYFYDSFPHSPITFGSEPSYGSYMSLSVDYIKLCTPGIFVDVPGATVIVVKQNLEEHLGLNEIEIYDLYGNNIAPEAFCSSYSRGNWYNGNPACLNDGVIGSGKYPDSCYSHSGEEDIANFDYCVLKKATKISKVKIFPFYNPNEPSTIESLRDIQLQLYAGMEDSGPSAKFLGLLADFRLINKFTEDLPYEQSIQVYDRFLCTNTEDPTHKTTTYISDYGTTYIAIPPLSDEGKVSAKFSCTITECMSTWYLSNGVCEKCPPENPWSENSSQLFSNCVKCPGGLVFDAITNTCKEDFQIGIISARGWRILTTNKVYWNVEELEFYSTTDCTGPFVEHSLGAIVESGHFTSYFGVEADAERAFGKPGYWQGEPDDFGSLYIGKVYDEDVEVRCIRVQNTFRHFTSELRIQAYNEVEDVWVTTFFAKNLDMGLDVFNLISMDPSYVASDQPSTLPSSSLTSHPSYWAPGEPSTLPSISPTSYPTSSEPTDLPSTLPSSSPTPHPSDVPSDQPSSHSSSDSPSSKNDVLTCSCTGDPNYKMWNNDYFSFQGNCDQILIDNDYLQLQVRTRPSTSFSLISQVALKLKNPDRTVFQFNRGNDVIFHSDSEIQYETTNEQFVDAKNQTWSFKPTHTFTFKEGEHDQYIKVTDTWHGGFGVNVKGHSDLFTGSKGMCGNWNGGMTKRDEDDEVIIVTNPTSINAVRSWQVDVGESILIDPSTYCEDLTKSCHDTSFFPDTTFDCYDSGRRRLRNNQGGSTVTPTSDLECADLSCADITDPIMRAFCESDVRISGDPRWACQIDYLISDVVTPDPCKFDVEKDNSKFLRGRKGGRTKIRSCGWLKKRKEKFRSRLCTKEVHYSENITTGKVFAPPQIACPDTCASCDKCFENPKTKYTHKVGEGDTPAVYKTCKWLAKKSPEKVKDICNKFESVGGYPTPIKACPVTCGLDTCAVDPFL